MDLDPAQGGWTEAQLSDHLVDLSERLKAMTEGWPHRKQVVVCGKGVAWCITKAKKLVTHGPPRGVRKRDELLKHVSAMVILTKATSPHSVLRSCVVVACCLNGSVPACVA